MKSRPGNCPYAPVVLGSGVGVTWGRKFPKGKAAGRNESEPVGSLVTKEGDADPVDVWGRPETWSWITEAVRGISRGSRGGMSRKINSPVLETRCGDG